jgi:hypothetical protein
MAQTQFDFNRKFTKQVLEEFSGILQAMQQGINFKVSARGWCYLMEQAGYINKAQFDKVAGAINRCRTEGYLPVDFVAEEKARQFSGVEKPNDGTVRDTLRWMMRDVLEGQKYFTPDWWVGEEYYIQIVVEKIDLLTLFEPICKEYHIPIANAKGWSSILQRAEYARRFKEAQDKGLQPVLLYCGDHDPDGLRISDTIRKNLEDIQDVMWKDGEVGFNPDDLEIQRFGLNYDFIKKNNYTWIDNLTTGSGGELAKMENGKIIQGKTKDGVPHKNFKLPYLQQYVKDYGVRKCEANAIVTTPDKAEELIRDEIEGWLGNAAKSRFQTKRNEVKRLYDIELEKTGLKAPIIKLLKEE